MVLQSWNRDGEAGVVKSEGSGWPFLTAMCRDRQQPQERQGGEQAGLEAELGRSVADSGLLTHWEN